MAAAFILHRVRDYDAWRKVYDSVSDFQKAGGVTQEEVHRSEGDPNNVLVFHRFGTLAQAHAFTQNAELREIMARAGVEPDSVRLEFYE